MTIEEINTVICKQCGAPYSYYSLLSTNNFFGEFASPLDATGPPKECIVCGSEEFIPEIDPLLLHPIDDLEFPEAILTILKPDFYYIGDLVALTDERLLALPDFTEEFLREVKDVLASRGLSIGCRLPPDWRSLANRDQ